MEEQTILQILDLLHTLQEACAELYSSVENGQMPEFQQLCSDMEAGLLSILNIVDEIDTNGNKKLSLAGHSILDTLKRIEAYYPLDIKNCLKKIEFELLPLLQSAYFAYYFFQYLVDHPEHLPLYYQKEKCLLWGNSYIDQALETGRYKYDLSISITGYNKLEYTKRCVESLLSNIPAGLNYELILLNHGSTDGTKEYFESIHPHKQLDIALNGGGLGVLYRIFEGEFFLPISNDVIVTPNTIENLLSCIRSDPKIAWVVPSTPNVSNFQTIPVQYASEKEFMDFALRNNKQDPFRWEQRVRLCPPLQIRRSSVFLATNSLCPIGHYHTTHPTHMGSFPDDRVSLLLRRNGYKMMLAKDAYCHHFGSVTLKTEIQRYDEQKYYAEGRREFFRAFHVDPWGTGFCFDPVFMERVVGESTSHTEVLGINCGLGSNSLKIKEQLKEYCHNLDVCLTNITSDPRFLEDLSGVSDKAEKVDSLKALKRFLAERRFDYIVWEDPFPSDINERMVLQSLLNALAPEGRLFMKRAMPVRQGWTELGNGWYRYTKVPA